MRRTGFGLGLILGFLVELCAGHDPRPCLPPLPPPPSPTALDHCDSREYDRVVARAKHLLGILLLWISLPRAWIQQD